jgi:hypothetical protein
MNPNSGENQPQIEYSAPRVGETEAKPAAEKSVTANPENNPQRSVQATAQAASDLALPATAAITTDQPAQDDSVPAATAAAPASEGDRIEKQWIDRAKAVIAKTQDDPFEQKQAMSKVKAEYIQKRFNKTVKTDDLAR